MAKILSINSGLNASVGYFEDGTPVFSIQEERLNREKNFGGFPQLSLRYLFDNIVKPSEIDKVVFTNSKPEIIAKEDYYRKYDRAFKDAIKASKENSLLSNIKSKLRRTALFELMKPQSDPKEVDDKSWLIAQGIDKSIIEYVDHHLCHAAAAYFGMAKDLDESYLVFTLDGGGDGLTSTVYLGKAGVLKKLSDSNAYSIGNIYSAITYFLGFKPHEHEYKLMGLSPYVKEEYARKYRDLLKSNIQVRGQNFENPEFLRHSLFMSYLIKNMTASRFDNIAGGLQMYTEDLVLEWIEKNIKEHGVRNIICSGGVFMNVKANQLISQSSAVDYVDVFPSCGDETNVFGAAFYAENQAATEKKVDLLNEFTLGPEVSELDKYLEFFKEKITAEKVSNPAEYIARLLSENQIVARCSGKMEFGARALGNRSILANPNSLANVAKINQAVKKRDFWMPFAPAILFEDLEEYFDVPKSLSTQKSPYMMFAFNSKKSKQEEIICGLHQSDKTGRAQTVRKDLSPGFYDVIAQFKKITGNSVVLNTSFNLHGFPIVTNAKEAIEVLLKSEIDVLMLEDYAVRRL